MCCDALSRFREELKSGQVNVRCGYTLDLPRKLLVECFGRLVGAENSPISRRQAGPSGRGVHHDEAGPAGPDCCEQCCGACAEEVGLDNRGCIRCTLPNPLCRHRPDSRQSDAHGASPPRCPEPLTCGGLLLRGGMLLLSLESCTQHEHEHERALARAPAHTPAHTPALR